MSFKLILFVSLVERLQNCLIDFAYNKMLLKTSVAAARTGTPFQPKKKHLERFSRSEVVEQNHVKEGLLYFRGKWLEEKEWG